MQKKWISGLGLAGVACVIGVATWMSPGVRGARVANGQMQSNAAVARFAMPTGASFESPQPIALDAAIARAAVRDGTLRIALPDGREHAIEIERQFTDESGHWNVVGRAPTHVGAQAMVLTFGANAVFGRIPMPDGSAMHVFTAPGNRVVVTPDGGVVPKQIAHVIGRTDAVLPAGKPASPQTNGTPRPNPATAQQPTRANASPRTSASPRTRATPDAHTTTPSAPVAAAPAPAPVDTTPVTIDVITLYAPDQVTLRGSHDAVATEVANLFAISNQAHIDSGSRVRLRSVHVRQLAVSTIDSNPEVLAKVASPFDIDGVSVEGLRDRYGGDLVTVLRPYHDTDWTCGVAYLPGMSYSRTAVSARNGYSVVNVDGSCGTLVHAHEIGHNLGAMHDRETDTDSSGVTAHGAYVFSSGYRTKAFATVMAYPDASIPSQEWIARFSNPAQNTCLGKPCGIAGFSDNVRTFNLTAPAIAAFRGPQMRLSMPDVEAIEPAYQWTEVTVPVRLSGVAPAGGLIVQIEVTGGTATQGIDYDAVDHSVYIGPGEREGQMIFNLIPDNQAEGEETVQFHLVAPAGTLVSDPDAVVTITDSELRQTISGNVFFPPGMAPQFGPISVIFYNQDGAGTSWSQMAEGPDWAYNMRVPYGMQVMVVAATNDPLIAPPVTINEVRSAQQVNFVPEPGVRVSGQLKIAPGMAFQYGERIELTIGRTYRDETSEIWWPMDTGYSWSLLVPKTTSLQFEIPDPPIYVENNAAQFVPFEGAIDDVRADTTYDIVLSPQPSALVCCWWNLAEPTTADANTDVGLAVHLSAPAPVGGAQVRWRTVDGSAKAGQDYVARSGIVTIPEGEYVGYTPTITLLPDAVSEGPEWFDVVIDRPVGVQITQARARIKIAAQLRSGGPDPKN